MPEVILHLSCLSIAPAWEGAVFQPRVGWLNPGLDAADDHLNDALLCYRTMYQGHPVSIHGLGILRPMRRAAMFEHRIWRRLLELDRDHKRFNPARLHLAPLIIRPRRRLLVAHPDIHTATLSIYVTPLAVQTQAIVTLSLGAIEQARQLKQVQCTLDGQPAGQLAQVVRDIHRQALTGMFAEPARSRLVATPFKEYCAVSADTPGLDLKTAQRQLQRSHVIARTARAAAYDEDDPAWKLIDHFNSVTILDEHEIRSARAVENWRHHKSCHFNNWNDLRFAYESLYWSLAQLWEWIESHPRSFGNPAVLRRLANGYHAVHSSLKPTGWEPVITALESCYEHMHSLTDIYDRVGARFPPPPPPLLSPGERRDYGSYDTAVLLALRQAHHDSLAILRWQQAAFGPLHVPPYVLIQIAQHQADLDQIDAELARRGIQTAEPAHAAQTQRPAQTRLATVG